MKVYLVSSNYPYNEDSCIHGAYKTKEAALKFIRKAAEDYDADEVTHTSYGWYVENGITYSIEEYEVQG